MPRLTLALAGALSTLVVLSAQSPEPKPAFPGQTDAPRPATPSAPVRTQTIATGLTGAWAVAFLPDGNFLVTQNAGTMRIVRPDGVVSGPLAGVPDVKSVAAQGLHDVVLDPDFARNRTLYFTYFAPPKGEAPATWPIEFFYERVWPRSIQTPASSGRSTTAHRAGTRSTSSAAGATTDGPMCRTDGSTTRASWTVGRT
jgi:glucose/arabinose dehydrogenase